MFDNYTIISIVFIEFCRRSQDRQYDMDWRWNYWFDRCNWCRTSVDYRRRLSEAERSASITTSSSWFHRTAMAHRKRLRERFLWFQLFMVLECRDSHQLIDCLSAVFSALKSGQLKPMVCLYLKSNLLLNLFRCIRTIGVHWRVSCAMHAPPIDWCFLDSKLSIRYRLRSKLDSNSFVVTIFICLPLQVCLLVYIK